MTKKWTATRSGIQPKRLASKRARAADKRELKLRPLRDAVSAARTTLILAEMALEAEEHKTKE